MSEARITNLSNESNTGGPTISGITTFSGANYFVPPVGSTAERPDNPEKGSIRFNTDTKHLEYFRGNTIGWVEIEASHGQLGGGTGSNVGTGVRGIEGGYHVYGDTIEYITISTLGDSQDFGNLSAGRYAKQQTVSSESRMIFAGGYYVNTIDYITVPNLGNATDFGDLTEPRLALSGCNDKIRGIWAGGQGPSHAVENTIDYVSIQSTGNAVDFGDLDVAKQTHASVSSSTRGIWNTDHPSPGGILHYANMRSTGNTEDFGDISNGLPWVSGGGSSSTRGIFAGGYIDNSIQYITMATLGNTSDFGDLTLKKFYNRGMSSSTRNVQGGGLTLPGSTKTNVCDYIEMATTGNAVDFGDMAFLTSNSYTSGGSNGHGGLSG